MRFVDFLKATVYLAAGAASALAAIAVVEASGGDAKLVGATLGWWVVAVAVGAFLGRRSQPNGAIAALLARATFARALPALEPGRVLLNRLWPLLALTVAAGVLALVVPPLPAIGAGFLIIQALALRHQHAAVEAIERRDGVVFYVIKTPPLKPIVLQRTPGFKAILPDEQLQARWGA